MHPLPACSQLRRSSSGGQPDSTSTSKKASTNSCHGQLGTGTTLLSSGACPSHTFLTSAPEPVSQSSAKAGRHTCNKVPSATCWGWDKKVHFRTFLFQIAAGCEGWFLQTESFLFIMSALEEGAGQLACYFGLKMTKGRGFVQQVKFSLGALMPLITVPALSGPRSFSFLLSCPWKAASDGSSTWVPASHPHGRPGWSSGFLFFHPDSMDRILSRSLPLK